MDSSRLTPLKRFLLRTDLLTSLLNNRYHKAHGHQTQQLHENGDGTFSIVNPETSAPYPGTLGMEKEKPFNCETCGKRYKNLNGLKYVSLRDTLDTPSRH